MNAKQLDYLREATAFVALSGLLICAPLTARGDETTTLQAPVITPAPARAIILPMLRVGGIPQGQTMQITEHGSELVAAAQLTLAAASAAAVASTRATAERKSASGLFCAGSM